MIQFIKDILRKIDKELEPWRPLEYLLAIYGAMTTFFFLI